MADNSLPPLSNNGNNGINIDWEREARTSVPEAVFAESKSQQALRDILDAAIERNHPLLFTRMSPEQADYLVSHTKTSLDYHELSRTMIVNATTASQTSALSVGVVAAGTSDMPVATEVQRTLHFFGLTNELHADVGVAGLWRLMNIQQTLQKHAVLIAVAGMEGALFSVLAGLVKAPIIAVPSSVGYGVSSGGHAALTSALASCSPGIVTVNIDNGFGAAAAAKKMLHIHTKNNH